MSDVQIYGADAADGSQQQQNVIVAQFTDEAVAKIIKAYAEQRQFDVRGYMIVVATLIASITYASAITPPGGFWSDDANGRFAGTSIWMDKFPLRYRFFSSCNTLSYVSSVSIIVILGTEVTWISKWILYALLVLHVTCLLGAFHFGCSAYPSNSIRTFILMGGFAALLCLVLAADALRRRWASKPKSDQNS